MASISSEQQFLFVDDIMEILHVSKSHAYKVIKELNDELKAKGYYTNAGRVPRAYFNERNYLVS